MMNLSERSDTTVLLVGDKVVQNLEELQNYFLVDEILRHFLSEKLHSWCKGKRYMEQLYQLYTIQTSYSYRTDIVKKLIFIFNIKNVFISPDQSIDADAYVKSDSQELKKEVIIKEFLDKPENVEKIVFDYLAVKENQNKIRK